MSDPNIAIRCRLELRGQVQGVGFRPYVYRLAMARGLGGYVANDSNGAVIEVEGPPTSVAAFERDLPQQLPPLAHIAHRQRHEIAPCGEQVFRIRTSETQVGSRPEVAPDAATCGDCRRELFSPTDRRYRYPFINCTNCGPRYSIIRDVPYDRSQTTMAAFRMCPACAREYADPADRRFHAQPNACAACGPQVQLRRVQPDGTLTPAVADPLGTAAHLLRKGRIVAIKGIGGYHLACRADAEQVVTRLRRRKLRDGKPLAIMADTLHTARRLCRLTPADEDALCSPAAPIVLAPARTGHGLAPSIAPGCNTLGVMLPYAPLHHLLFAEGLGPLVMTSANLSGHPLTYRDEEALTGLADVADAFLTHDRQILRPIDDSVVLTFRDEVVPIRRARGYAPQPIRLAGFADGEPLHSVRHRSILAVGGELKSTVCLLRDGEAVLSEHLGDLMHPQTYRHFVHAIDRLEQLCTFVPDLVACDLHPRYLSTVYAQQLGLPVLRVQHHHAHIASVMAEWGECGPVVGLACDGTGYGTDGTVWGGEILLCERGEFVRAGHLVDFPLVGGDRAAIETWRPAAALLRAAGQADWQRIVCAGHERPSAADLRLFERQAANGLNALPTSSLGRVFDAVAFLLGLCPRNRHEAEAAMSLEAAAAQVPEALEPLPHHVSATERTVHLSLFPALRAIVAGRGRGEPVATLAARFHDTLIAGLADAAGRVCRQRRIEKVALSGGCFANRRLLTGLTARLEAQGLRVLYHRQVPAGDGGLALGQSWVAAWRAADR